MTRHLLAIATIAAAFAAGAAQAGEADYGSNLPQAQGQRDRTQVRAEAVDAARNNAGTTGEGAFSSNVAPQVQSQRDRAAVRNEAAQAVRLGQIAHGEAAI